MTLKTAISKAIEQGKESITVMSMATGVRMYLEERGYKITHMNAYQYSNDQRDTDYWTISW
ncbi:hypothetical protein [Deinococcus humi]|uniref:Uncharacterized protein n=1 Tax=Deinococcus humi TaxID=662880 RepID=A0A7W8JWK3_9DEIO|nr:hypothetical protein [Deinococcus humi]MBB5363071.1 hypothetical protein [Deinococcus humi]